MEKIHEMIFFGLMDAYENRLIELLGDHDYLEFSKDCYAEALDKILDSLREEMKNEKR